MKTKKNEKKRIKIGLFGFGKTGRMVANEFIKDDLFDLQWVVRRTHKDNTQICYASFRVRNK